MQPQVLRLRRLVTAEAGRFPELGQSFYDLGPKRAAEQFALALRDTATRRGSALEDPDMAAEHLLCADPFNPAEPGDASRRPHRLYRRRS